MKKISTCLIIMLLLGGILGIAFHGVHNTIKEDASAIISALEFICPTVAYADTLLVPNPQPPPPID